MSNVFKLWLLLLSRTGSHSCPYVHPTVIGYRQATTRHFSQSPQANGIQQTSINKQTFTLTCPFENPPTIRILPYGKGTLKDLRNHLIETMEGYRELDGSSIRKIRQVVQDETRDKITLLPTWQDLRTNICRVVMG